MTYHVAYGVAQLPYCCGVLEVGLFQENTNPMSLSGSAPFQRHSEESFKDAWSQALDSLRNDSQHVADFIYNRIRDTMSNEEYEMTQPRAMRMLCFNFVNVNQCQRKEFIGKELIELLEEQPDCVLVGEFINANTGNTVRTYFLTNNL